VIIRPLTPDFPWDQYDDLVARAFGPGDEALIRPSFGVGRALMTALTDLMTMRGYPLAVLFPATMTIYRSLGWEIAGHLHEAVLPSRALGALPRADPAADAALDGAFAATPFMLDDF
jgi:hypothetical protein